MPNLMSNDKFLERIAESFLIFLEKGSRSSEKLEPLHGSIASDLNKRLGNDYIVKALGFEDSKKAIIQGRYLNKKVDITILDKQNNPIAGIGLKFVMQNYAQNSNNYFENMLGETANIRSNGFLYFQILIIPRKLPYYNRDGIFQKWEIFGGHYVKKYEVLSGDDPELLLHSPSKTLLYIIDIPEVSRTISNNSKNFHIKNSDCTELSFNNGVVLNNYEEFIQKVVYRILSI